VTINSSDVVLKNLTISGSGSRMENLDSAIIINKAKRCIISGCKITDCLYGIDMAMVNDSAVTDNYITSNTNDISLRGDALKIWYSNNNIIENNIIDSSRDVTLTRSNDNIIKDFVTLHPTGLNFLPSVKNTKQISHITTENLRLFVKQKRKNTRNQNTLIYFCL